MFVATGSGGGTGGRNSHALPSRPAVNTPRRNTPSSTPPRSTRAPAAERTPPNKIVPRTTPTSSGMKKWPSNPSTDQHNGGSHHSPAR